MAIKKLVISLYAWWAKLLMCRMPAESDISRAATFLSFFLFFLFNSTSYDTYYVSSAASTNRLYVVQPQSRQSPSFCPLTIFLHVGVRKVIVWDEAVICKIAKNTSSMFLKKVEQLFRFMQYYNLQTIKEKNNFVLNHIADINFNHYGWRL